MKKFLAMALALVMVFALCACGAKAAPAATPAPAAPAAAPAPAAEAAPAAAPAEPAGPDYTEIVLKFGTSSAEGTLTVDAFKHWGELMSAASDGKVGVDVYASSVLGNNTEMTQGAQLGTIDVVVIQPAGIADMGSSKMNLLSLPYLFGSYDQYYNTLFGEVGETLLQDVTDNVEGLVGFSYLPDGGRCYFTNGKAITCIDDIKGMKLRIQTYAIDGSTAEAIGFSATPTAFAELYSALQTGVVEGAEQPLSGIDGNKFYEVCDHLTLDNHTYNIPVLLMSQKTWDSLTPDTQALLKEKWEETVEEFYKPQLADYESGLLASFQEKGMTIHEITDYDKWVEAVAPVWAEYGAGLEDMIAVVQATK